MGLGLVEVSAKLTYSKSFLSTSQKMLVLTEMCATVAILNI